VTSHRLSTARARLVATLAEEIMRRDDTAPFAIESEHQLCRRFQISRVTVRLALGDLENRGLIYRKHGKGTFAHGQAKQNHRDIGFLIKNAPSREDRSIAEMIRGAQAFMTPLRAGVVLLSREPESWRPDLAGSLGGVIVAPEGVTERDLQVLRERKVPFLFAAPSELAGPKINFGQEEAARTMTERLLRLGHRQFALLSGSRSPLDEAKRAGIHEALQAAGINAAQVPELRSGPVEEEVEPAMAKFLQLRPRPTALIAFDDSLATMASFYVRRAGMRIPRDLSVAGFNDCPVLRYAEPALSTAGFEFFAAGRRAAEALHHATLTGIPVTDLFFEPVYREGETVAAPAAVEEKAA
jgi:DNA-binding LacI/PurR family transcriptional regulator